MIMKRKTQIWLAAILLTLSACNNSNSAYHCKADTRSTMRHDTTGNTPNDSDMSKMQMDTTRH